MKKKLVKKSRRKTSLFNKRYFSILIISIISLFLIFIGLTQDQKNNNVCANSISCTKDLSGKYDKDSTQGVFMGRDVKAPFELVDAFLPQKTLGSTTGQKRIEINLSTQQLFAYEGNDLVYNFPVSTGKWYETPTGTFYTWIKLRYTRMTGGSKELRTYYNLPNVPYTMYFYNSEIPQWRGFGIHGAYWHNNFGHPMSHGCVNMRIEDAGKLYDWADPPTKAHTTYANQDSPGTMIVIYGKTPNS